MKEARAAKEDKKPKVVEPKVELTDEQKKIKAAHKNQDKESDAEESESDDESNCGSGNNSAQW